MSAVANAGKPVLRGFLRNNTIKHAISLGVLCIMTTGAVKIFFVDARKKRYEEFYKHYDIDKDYVRMREAGVFRSVPPKGHKEL